ncbi:MAG: hypothetical protein NZ840_13330 [Anaerolineales bacterium]|nr:hypothetical protein [Anaerolineales bacterium]MDW8163017.1 hypothetical protein [Anaerolineales bacterium]
MSKEIRDVTFAAAGFIFGVWLYYLYQEGGFSLMLSEGWKGLAAAFVFLGLVVVWDRVRKR